MPNRSQLQIDRLHDSPWDPETVLTEALAEKAEFLRRHPQHRELQKEIDHLLDKAGNRENRMAVMAMLLEGKMVELHSQLKKLNKFLVNAEETPAFNELLKNNPHILNN